MTHNSARYLEMIQTEEISPLQPQTRAPTGGSISILTIAIVSYQECIRHPIIVNSDYGIAANTGPVSRILFSLAMLGRESRSFIWRLFQGRSTRSTQSLSAAKCRQTRRATSRFLFDLAPDGVCPAPLITLGAVVSYTTFSPLLRALVGAVCFLWHYPSSSILRRVPGLPGETGHPALRSPDFPPGNNF